jgi:hypothetical protein
MWTIKQGRAVLRTRRNFILNAFLDDRQASAEMGITETAGFKSFDMSSTESVASSRIVSRWPSRLSRRDGKNKSVDASGLVEAEPRGVDAQAGKTRRYDTVLGTRGAQERCRQVNFAHAARGNRSTMASR